LSPNFCDQELHPLLWAGLRATRGTVTTSVLPNYLRLLRKLYSTQSVHE